MRLVSEYMWPLTRKRSERLAVLKLIAVHQPFKRTGIPFERLEQPVLKKFIIRSNGLGYPFKKTHQPFERLKLSVRKKSSAVRTAQAIHSRNSSAVRMAQAIRSRNSSAVRTARAVRARKKQWVFLAAVPTRQDFKTNRHALLHDTNSCHQEKIFCLSRSPIATEKHDHHTMLHFGSTNPEL